MRNPISSLKSAVATKVQDRKLITFSTFIYGTHVRQMTNAMGQARLYKSTEIVTIIDIKMAHIPRIGDKLTSLDIDGKTFYHFTVTEVTHSVESGDIELIIKAEPHTFATGIYVPYDGPRAHWRDMTKSELHFFLDNEVGSPTNQDADIIV